MLRETITVEIEAACEEVFDIVHDYTRRLEWDSMLTKAEILGEDKIAGKGVQTRCVGNWSTFWIAMETEYVNFKRGHVAAVKLVNNPPFFEKFAATIRHERLSATRSRICYTFSFCAKPRFLAFALEPLMKIVICRETKKRLLSLRSFMAVKSST